MAMTNSGYLIILFVPALGRCPSEQGVGWIIYVSKIQLVVYYQRCILIGWATTRLYVIAY